MPRFVATLVGISSLLLADVSPAAGQQFDVRPLVLGQNPTHDGRIRGVVRDEAGRAIADARVLALGRAPMPRVARTDAAGEFTLTLPPGDYVLRATRDGFVSGYREPIHVEGRSDLERTIVLTRASTSRPTRVIVAGVATGEGAELDAPDDAAGVQEADARDHPHNETAWRLRRLRPTALRDLTGLDGPEAPAAAQRPRVSFVDWVMGESARAAAAFLTNTDFTGQVNFLTTSSVAAAAGSWLPAEVPRGVAYAAVGAPVGSSGDWSVRGALSAGAVASWVVVGEYAARNDQRHAVRLGASYSSQPIAAGNSLEPAPVADRLRTVGGIYGFDRWQLTPGVELDYGTRVDRYDYVSDAQFLSPRAGVRLRVLPGTRVAFSASERVLAPGAGEFLPPSAGGPWVPPERTFSPLVPDASFRVEHVRHLQAGVEQQLSRAADGPLLSIRKFRQSSDNQIATLYGLNADRSVGHYFVATPGSVSADGWVIALSTPVWSRLHGSVEYTTARADWLPDAESAPLAAVVPSVARAGRDRVHDLTGSLNAVIPETSTRVIVAYRVAALSSLDAGVSPRARVGRFDVEVRQALPVRLPRSSHTDLIVVIRNLSRDAADRVSLYDELLTVSPPMRVMGGVQVKF